MTARRVCGLTLRGPLPRWWPAGAWVLALAVALAPAPGFARPWQEPAPDPAGGAASPGEAGGEESRPAAPAAQGSEATPAAAEPGGEASGSGAPAEESGAPAGAQAASGEKAAPKGPRIAFELPVPADQGGGTIAGTAGSIEFRRSDYAVLTGGVELRYQDLVLTAFTAEVDLAARVVKAEGDVVLDEGPRRLTGATATWDMDARTGTLTDATAYVNPDYYFSGKEISKVGPETYTVVQGVFTSCDEAVPDWSFRLARARVTVEGYARIRNASIRIKKAPVFYFPYILWPAKTERASGFLVPQPGYSSRRGTSLSLGYFQTLGRSVDTTLYADLYTEDYLGVGNELRYHPTAGTYGLFEGYAIRDPERNDDWRWRLALDHTSENLPWGMRAVVQHRDVSDFDYYRDFERDFSQGSIRSLVSRGFVTGNWGAHSLNLQAESRETLVSANSTIVQRRLPEAEYRLRPTRLGKVPLYLEIDSSLGYLDLERSATYKGSYGRADLMPTLTLPIRTWPWLSFSLTAGERLTWWGDSLCVPGGEGEDACPGPGRSFTGESLSRTLPVVEAEIIGPSFSRIFEREVGAFAKLKHIIEPRWTYNYRGELDDRDSIRVPLFDEIDNLSSTNVGRFALVQRLLAKPKEPPPEEEEEGTAGTAVGAEGETAAGEAAEGPAAAAAEGTGAGEEGAGETEAGAAAPGAAQAAAEETAAPDMQASTAPEPGAEAAGEPGTVEAPPQAEAGPGVGTTSTAAGAAGAEAAAAEEALPAAAISTSAREIASFEIAQAVSFDPDQPLQRSGQMEKREGPITALLRVNPSPALNLQVQTSYNTLFDRLTSRSLSGSALLPGNNRIGLAWFTRLRGEDGETLSDQARLTADLNLWPDRLRLRADVNYDIEESFLQQQRYAVQYTSQCFSWVVEYRDNRIGTRRDRDYRLTITLKNVGTFLDLAGRQSNQSPR